MATAMLLFLMYLYIQPSLTAWTLGSEQNVPVEFVSLDEPLPTHSLITDVQKNRYKDNEFCPIESAQSRYMAHPKD